MSAFFSFQYDDCIQLLTDGGFFDAHGNLVHVGSKVMRVSGMPIVLSGRGVVSDVFSLPATIEKRIGNLGLLGTVDRVLDALREMFRGIAKDHGHIDVEYIVAAWSETAGPQHYFVHLHGHWPTPAFELANLGAQMAGGPPVAWDDIAHLGLTAEDVASSDFPSVHGVAVMNAMRGKLGRIPGTESNIYGVGGLCELTTVSEQGVASRFLCHYPDQLGKPVDPAQQALQ